MEFNHPDPDINQLTHKIIGCAIEVHKELRAGLYENPYQECLGHELKLQGLAYAAQVSLPITYKGLVVPNAYFMDFVVEDKVILEIKAVDKLIDIHDAQCFTYLKFSGHRICLLINFNVPKLTEGIRRFVI